MKRKNQSKSFTEEKQVNCSYTVLKKYLSDRSRPEALKHAADCLDCMEKLVATETWLATRVQENALLTGTSQIQSGVLLSTVDRYLTARQKGKLETFLAQDKNYLRVSSDETAYKEFQQLLMAYDSPSTVKPTPLYLKKIIQNRLAVKSSEVAETSGLVILLKDGIRLLSGAMEGLFVMPDTGQAIATRSTSTLQQNNDSGALQFMLSGSDSGQIQYQVVQDSEDTEMLTIHLENFTVLPKFVNLKKEGRLLHSFSMKNNVAYFPQLGEGSYCVELKDYAGRITRRMDVHVFNQ